MGMCGEALVREQKAGGGKIRYVKGGRRPVPWKALEQGPRGDKAAKMSLDADMRGAFWVLELWPTAQ